MSEKEITKVGMVLAAVRSAGETGYHSAKLIADLGLPRQTVANCLQQLKKKGLAEIKSGGRGRNGAFWVAVPSVTQTIASPEPEVVETEGETVSEAAGIVAA